MKNKIKPIKMWMVEFENNKKFIAQDIYDTHKEALLYARDCADGLRYRIIPVLITPLSITSKAK